MATRTKKTFGVSCPHCHSTDDTVTIDLNDLDEIRCTGCDETFSVEEAVDLAREEMARWEKVARWVEIAKTL